MRIDYATDWILIRQSADRVFNFVARGAQYPKWHFDYHLRAQLLDIRPEGIGSVFSIEEIIDGFYLRHVGHVVEFERNRRFVWRGRFALLNWIWIGTDLMFTEVAEGTEVKETLYFELSPLLLPAAFLFAWRRAFRPQACRKHIVDELTGIKTMLENGDHEPADVTDPFADQVLMAEVKRYNLRAQGTTGSPSRAA